MGEAPSERGTFDQLLSLIDHLPAMVAHWDGNLCNRVANAAHVEWFGLTPEEMRGMHLRDFLGPAVFEANWRYIEAVLAGQPQYFERTLVDRRGADRHAQMFYIPDIVDGAVDGFFVMVNDVTARIEAERALAQGAERLERSADQYRALVRNIPGGFVLLFDPDMRHTVADGAALAAWGISREQLEGCLMPEVLAPELVVELVPRYRAALSGRSVTWDHVMGDRVYNLTAGPVRDADGLVFAGMVVCADVTAERRSEHVAHALHAIATVVANNAPLSEIARFVADNLCDVFASDAAAVFRFSEPGHAAVVVMSPADSPFEADVQLGVDDRSAVAAVLRTGRPAIVSYAAGGEDFAARQHASGHRAGAAAPIRVHGTAWGAIALAWRDPAAIDDLLLERLVSFAELVEIAIANAEAQEALARQATTDGITGLPNHRAFHDLLAREVARAQRDQRPLSLVMLDIDHFKAVNDTFGHPVGDLVLAEVARRLAGIARGHETVARIGGEEFAWLLSETDAESAFLAAERARQAVAEEAFAEVGSVTVSAGVCSLAEASDGDTLVRLADRALYWAKHSGRDMTFRYTLDAREMLPAPPGPVANLQLMNGVRALARAIDAKDSSTREHSERVASLAARLARELGWTGGRVHVLFAAGLVHDVGKIGVSDEILLKAGPLAAAEYELVMAHAELGARIASEVVEPDAVAWIRSHHERWDGTGYPSGLAGEGIPDGARLLALADAWDVMTANCSYQPRRSVEDALQECERLSGRQFAPAAVSALVSLHRQGQLGAGGRASAAHRQQ